MTVIRSTCTRLMTAALLLLAAATLANARDAVWTGGWDTVWRDGGSALYLEQEGSVVTGRYPALEGVLSGEARGNVLVGQWKDSAGTGSFVFSLSPDRQTFAGRFGNGEWWNGKRMPEVEGREFGADVSSPRAALRTILLAGNATKDDRYDDLSRALQVLDFDDIEPTRRDTAIERLTLARMLFAILDKLTFRVWDIPSEEGFDEDTTVTLHQAGTRETFDLEFRYRIKPNGAAGWFIVVPPRKEMESALERLGGSTVVTKDLGRAYARLKSPRDAMRSFLEGYANWKETGDAQLMMSAMNRSALAPSSRVTESQHMAEYLKGVIDRVGQVVWQEIPDFADGEDPYQYFVHPVGRVEIAPYVDADGNRTWQLSDDTVANARELFLSLEDMPLAPGLEQPEPSGFLKLRSWIRSIDRDLLDRLGGVEIWQWIVLGTVLIGVVLIDVLAIALFRRIARAAPRARPEGEEETPQSGTWGYVYPIAVLFAAGVILLMVNALSMPQNVGVPLQLAASVMLVAVGGWLAYNLVDVLMGLAGERSLRVRSTDQLMRSIIIALLKIAIILGTLLLIAEVLEIPWEGVAAGVGIGGIAIALAARSTLENFLGGLTLLADRPVRAGDFCRFGDKVGTVESLGLRSIRIRSLDRTVYTIPNGEFINLHIENYSKRDRILLKSEINLRYETTPDQMRWVLSQIRRLLLAHPKVLPEPARARFVQFGSHSLDIEIFAYVACTDYSEFLAIKEDINLRLADIVEASGTSFAFPSSVTYLARDPGVDAEKTDKAENAVEAWRNNDRLPFPEFPNEERWEMIDTLEYPGPGSPDSRAAQERKRAAAETS